VVVDLTLKESPTEPYEKVGGCPAPHEIAALIDEIGAMLPEAEAKQKMIKALQKQLQPYADKMKALTALVSALEGHGPNETFEVPGVLFTAAVGKRYVIRTVTNPRLAIKLLNKAEKEIAWKVITVPLGKLDTYLTPGQKTQVIKVDRGERPIVIVKKGHGQSA
jgi:hypothetical protein